MGFWQVVAAVMTAELIMGFIHVVLVRTKKDN